MVFIHGGQYLHGAAASYPVDGIINNFVKRGVIVVTIDYRINIFGTDKYRVFFLYVKCFF